MGKLLYLILQFIPEFIKSAVIKGILIHLSDYVKDHVQSYYGTEPAPFQRWRLGCCKLC